MEVLQADAGRFIENDGFDTGPMESNSVVAVTWRSVSIPLSGQVDVPVTLGRANASSGYNHFLARVEGNGPAALSNHLLVYRSA